MHPQSANSNLSMGRSPIRVPFLVLPLHVFLRGVKLRKRVVDARVKGKQWRILGGRYYSLRRAVHIEQSGVTGKNPKI